ncbi:MULTISPECIES: nitroreductase family deazaflavin-dependent oxidoreductase [unclassified Streptomyces]|uniref:nitroreductase family deazaflavin-dependent oxidoreductase n=1 Tax=unclassified Streptomyces TaxID=2593676 RepID=UPI0022527E9B|nr:MULTISPECIES: nitroreductase family deazaflavin-dependent oxidoreductase [unclassified Streptomyces]MCX4885689.1 nitroreductase family deazaflavin-dependent oxidoreductase [Streptomyces sp. NBC_00847]MCX5425561.1 nitroreductase family deazaflavin-dependent oxidoreductase [Streptomyces sp. NBC_00078]
MPHRQTAPDRPRLPVGWRRFAARLPVLLFRSGLGWIFGGRLLLLHHTGRVTGLDRRVVLEVVEHEPADGSWIIASGFGPKAAWYRNLRAEPKTLIEVGNRRHAVTAHFLTQDDGAEIMARYARRHPRTARRLCRFMGLLPDGTVGGFREAGRALPFVRLDAGSGNRLQ